MIIEYGHIYISDIINNNINNDEIVKSINIAKNIISGKNIKFTKVVLIDDKEFNINSSDKKFFISFIKKHYASLGMEPDYVYFEKELSEYSDFFYKSVDVNRLKTEYFRKDKKNVEFFFTKNFKVPIKQIKDNQQNYSCPFLASLWAIFKLKKFNSAITILNKKYYNVENQVLDILETMDINYEKHTYYWYE